jgi:transcriptional regulator with XRE-family HTH domain
MDDALRRLGIRIRELRSRRGWSQEAFADIAGVHRTYMGHLERGEKNLSFLSILRVAKALGITLSGLLAGFEKGESARLANRKTSSAPAASRGRALGQVATMERSLRALKGVLAETAASSKRDRRSRKNPPKIKRRKSL